MNTEKKPHLTRQEIDALKDLVSLQEEIEKIVPLRPGPRYWRGIDRDSLIVDIQEQIYYWNSKSSQPGDVITWLMEQRGYSFIQAINYLREQSGYTQDEVHEHLSNFSWDQNRRPQLETVSPPPAWQRRAREIIRQSQKNIWKEVNRPTIEMLHHRGFTDETIFTARLGWNPSNLYDPPKRWGLAGGRKIFTPRGLVIPWLINDEVWRIRGRRSDEDLQKSNGPRYINPRIYPHDGKIFDHEPIYLISTISSDKPIILVEGELDALTLYQEARDIVTAVATGSVGGSRRITWLNQLVQAPQVFVAFDADRAGEEASQYWMQALSRAKRLRPLSKDVNQMLQDGHDVRSWIARMTEVITT